MARRNDLRWLAPCSYVLAACGGSARSPGPTPAPVGVGPVASVTASAPSLHATCPTAIDVRDLLARHARAFGGADAVEAALPRVQRSELEGAGKRGVREIVVDRTRVRSETSFAGFYTASGVDPRGAWEVHAGVVVRLEPGEDVALAQSAWLLRRRYVTDFVDERGSATCRVDGTPKVVVHYDLPALGRPDLELDLATATLISSTFTAEDGVRTTTEFEAWSETDAAGVRWAKALTGMEPGANRVLAAQTRVVKATHGVACEGVDPRVPSSKDCLAPPAPTFEIAWPASGIVRVPMQYHHDELFLRAKLGSREMWALLDSGAGLTSLDAGAPAAASFKPSMEFAATGATSAVHVGLGEVDAINVGALALRHVPAFSLPLPAFEDYGDRRPEVVVGVSVFLGAVVRVDYAAREIAFARTSDPIKTPKAIAVPIRVLGGVWVVDVDVEGSTAPLQIDTGNSGGVSLRKRWTDLHGLPGAHPSLEYQGRFGAGDKTTSRRLVRLGRTSVGPIRDDGALVSIDDPPGSGLIAGLLGNQMFSRCAAVVFDFPNRKMWLEPPCDRPLARALAGWRLARNDGSARKDRPWVVSSIIPTGPAAKAGLEVGDRLLEVSGVPATLAARERIEELEQRPAGTKVVVVVERGTETKRLVLDLQPLLAP